MFKLISIFCILLFSAADQAHPAWSSGARSAVLPFSFVPHRQGMHMQSLAAKSQGRPHCPKAQKAKSFAQDIRRASQSKKQGPVWTLSAKLSGDKKPEIYFLDETALQATLFRNARALAVKKILSIQGRYRTLFFRVGKCRWYVPAFASQKSGEVDLMQVSRKEFIALIKNLNQKQEPIWPPRAAIFKSNAYPGRGKSLQRLRGSVKRTLKDSTPAPVQAKPSPFKAAEFP